MIWATRPEMFVLSAQGPAVCAPIQWCVHRGETKPKAGKKSKVHLHDISITKNIDKSTPL